MIGSPTRNREARGLIALRRQSALRRARAVIVRRPAVRAYKRLLDRRLEKNFELNFLPRSGLLSEYRAEVEDSGLIEHLEEQADNFRRSVRGVSEGGEPYKVGRVGRRAGLHLYAIARTLEPRIVVETGVCNGFSTAFLLLAIEQNGAGELISIDLPEVAGKRYAPETFWAGKGPEVIPEGKEPGWVIPDRLKSNWTLIIGRSQEELPRLLRRIGTIDSFFHDSEHSYECMWFEFTHAYAALRGGGVLISDDVNKNSAFFDFAREVERKPVRMSWGTALLVK